MLNIKQYYDNIFGSETIKSKDDFHAELIDCFKQQVSEGHTEFVFYPMCDMTIQAQIILNAYFGISPLFTADDYFCQFSSNIICCSEIANRAPDSIVIIVDNRAHNYDSIRRNIREYVPENRIVDAFPVKPLYRQDSRIISVELASREIYRHNIPGDIAELGVYRGYMAEYINEFFPDRKFHLFDTFKGFDKRDCELEHQRGYSAFLDNELFLDTNYEIVIDKMSYPQNCIFHKGYFPETTQEVDIDIKFCFVHLDADLYIPIKAGLEYFYPRLSPGGYIFVHDFNGIVCKGVREAVEEYCRKTNIGYVCLPDSIEKGTAVIVKGL